MAIRDQPNSPAILLNKKTTAMTLRERTEKLDLLLEEVMELREKMEKDGHSAEQQQACKEKIAEIKQLLAGTGLTLEGKRNCYEQRKEYYLNRMRDEEEWLDDHEGMPGYWKRYLELCEYRRSYNAICAMIKNINKLIKSK